MEVDPLISGFLGGCKRAHLGLPYKHSAQVNEAAYKRRSFFLGRVQIDKSTVILCCLDPSNPVVVLDGHSLAGEGSIFCRGRVQPARDGNLAPEAIIGGNMQGGEPVSVC